MLMVTDSQNASLAAKASKVRRMPRTLAGQIPASESGERKAVLALYEKALKLMQSGEYDKAHGAFNAMLATAPQDLADRVRMYISACVAQITKGSTSFLSHEERYDYAVSLLNHGHYEDAREHFQQILLDNGSADYAFYGLALLASMTGETEKCIEHLTSAIRLKSDIRFQARSDSDFDSVADDPRFTELLYPEV